MYFTFQPAKIQKKSYTDQFFYENLQKKCIFIEKTPFFALFDAIFMGFSIFFCTFVVRMTEPAINIKGRLYSLASPKVMAIINATTDSFAFSCTNISEAEVLAMAAKALAEGADILDVGACSTRPGSTPVGEEEEWRRLNIALKAIRTAYPDAVVSVDTFRSEIARRAVTEWGADVINDISGGIGDMFTSVAELGVPYILTHNAPLEGKRPVSVEVIEYLIRKVDELHRLGVKDVIIDPGFGFNKDVAQCTELLTHLGDLQLIGLPVLVGLSRKSMLYKPLGVEPASDEALAATVEANKLALSLGATVFRVHDVAIHRQSLIP